MLGQDEYERARRSTQDAHYTSSTVIAGIYEGLERLGFKGGKVLEPAAGTGNFIGLMPAEMRRNSRITAIELDPLTAQIGAHLYPSSTFINRGLQDVAIPSAYFDACVANPPSDRNRFMTRITANWQASRFTTTSWPNRSTRSDLVV